MGALIYDSVAQAWKDSETPKIYSGGAWADSEGKIYDNGASAWVDAWAQAGWPDTLYVVDGANNINKMTLPSGASFGSTGITTHRNLGACHTAPDYVIDLSVYNHLYVTLVSKNKSTLELMIQIQAADGSASPDSAYGYVIRTEQSGQPGVYSKDISNINVTRGIIAWVSGSYNNETLTFNNLYLTKA